MHYDVKKEKTAFKEEESMDVVEDGNDRWSDGRMAFFSSEKTQSSK